MLKIKLQSFKFKSQVEKYMNPAAIAQQYWNCHAQDKSTWTFEVDLRPMLEDW